MSDQSIDATTAAAGADDNAGSRSTGRRWTEPTFDRGRTGMACFLATEGVFFSTLILSYAIYIGQSKTGPTPREALSLPLVIGTSACLLSSSLTIIGAHRGLRRGNLRRFFVLLGSTMLLGALFLAGTSYEWWDLIVNKHLLPGTNLFGTTFYTLVGFHAFHVTMGIIAMAILLAVVARGWISQKNPKAVELVSWYWHLVDGVWVVIFTVVYVISR